MVKLSNIKSTLTDDNEIVKVIKTILWIAGVITVIILFYVNDTSAKYVSKDIYETEKNSLSQNFEEFKARTANDNKLLSGKIDTLTASVNTLTIAVNSQIAQQELRHVSEELEKIRQSQK